MAPVTLVWESLTTPDLMKQWMLDTDMDMDIHTDWKIGSPIMMKGEMHGIPFENAGTILSYEPNKVLVYSHLSSLSQLPDSPENYCTLTFRLIPTGKETLLELSITNFPTYSIFAHMDFYWRTSLEILKSQLENPLSLIHK